MLIEDYRFLRSLVAFVQNTGSQKGRKTIVVTINWRSYRELDMETDVKMSEFSPVIKTTSISLVSKCSCNV